MSAFIVEPNVLIYAAESAAPEDRFELIEVVDPLG